MDVLRKLQYLCILPVALSFIPISTFLLLINYLYRYLLPTRSLRRHLRGTTGFRPRTVLLSGINTPQGLRLARAFHDTGHNVIGLDHQRAGLPTPIRFSKTIRKFYFLGENVANGSSSVSSYAASLIEIIKRERVDIWLNCHSLADPSVDAEIRDAIERTTNCHCFAPLLNNAHLFTSWDSFISYTSSLGLPVPETHQVGSRDELHRVLNRTHGERRFTLHNAQREEANNSRSRMPLPKRTVSQTYHSISRISITKTTPWKLEQDTAGMERYSTFAIVARGKVRAFVASFTASDSSLHLLDPTSTLNKSMLRFVRSFVHNQSCNLDLQLGIDFCIEEQVTETGVERKILPVGAAVHAHVNTLLFRGISGSVQLAQAYIACFEPNDDMNGKQIDSISHPGEYSTNQAISMPEPKTTSIYSLGQVLAHLMLEPLQKLLTRTGTISECFGKMLVLFGCLFQSTDDSYSFEDPLPFWWCYQVFVPVGIIMDVVAGKDVHSRARIAQ